MSLSFLSEELASIERANLRRSLHYRTCDPGRTIVRNDQVLLNFSSNNYLGLARHPTISREAARHLQSGTGSTASRLVTGSSIAHQQLESDLAHFHKTEGALLFNSGYQANIGVLSSLTGHGDLIVADRLNHASLIDGCRLSKAAVKVADHCDVDSFARFLEEGRDARRRFVVTDSVFSMDGDIAPLEELHRLCIQYEASLVVDEAHAVGVLGGGRGMCAELGVSPDVLVGGFGKAFGSFGAYVAGSANLVDFLIHRARSFVFSTALPPCVVGASHAALHIVSGREGQSLRDELHGRMEELRTGLGDLGLLAPGAGFSPIFPIVLGSEEHALHCARELARYGLLCSPIRPPTVPKGTSRLRIALSALHTEADVSYLLRRIGEVCSNASA